MPVMTPNPALGVLAKLAIGPANPTTLPLDFESETLGARSSFLDPQGLRGTVAHAAARVRENSRLVTGDIEMVAPTAVELSYMMQYILGGTPAAPSYPLAETLPAFFTQILRGASRFTYSGCRVNQAVFSARKGSQLGVTLSILGIDVTKDATAFPVLTIDNTTGYFAFEDLVFTVNGDTVDIFDWSLTIQNFVQARMVNSVTATAVYRTDRVITGRFTVPWGDDEALYGLAVGGVTLSSVFTNGGTSLSFTSPKFQVPRQDPDVRGRDEMRNVLEGACRFSAAAGDELVVALDAIP